MNIPPKFKGDVKTRGNILGDNRVACLQFIAAGEGAESENVKQVMCGDVASMRHKTKREMMGEFPAHLLQHKSPLRRKLFRHMNGRDEIESIEVSSSSGPLWPKHGM